MIRAASSAVGWTTLHKCKKLTLSLLVLCVHRLLPVCIVAPLTSIGPWFCMSARKWNLYVNSRCCVSVCICLYGYEESLYFHTPVHVNAEKHIKKYLKIETLFTSFSTIRLYSRARNIHSYVEGTAESSGDFSRLDMHRNPWRNV